MKTIIIGSKYGIDDIVYIRDYDHLHGKYINNIRRCKIVGAKKEYDKMQYFIVYTNELCGAFYYKEEYMYENIDIAREKIKEIAIKEKKLQLQNSKLSERQQRYETKRIAKELKILSK